MFFSISRMSQSGNNTFLKSDILLFRLPTKYDKFFTDSQTNMQMNV